MYTQKQLIFPPKKNTTRINHMTTIQQRYKIYSEYQNCLGLIQRYINTGYQVARANSFSFTMLPVIYGPSRQHSGAGYAKVVTEFFENLSTE